MNKDLRIRIIDKASVLFTRYGVKTVTMDYIATQMGISKRTLYENFKDKDQLLLESILYIHKETENEAEEIYKTAENSLDLLLKFFHTTWHKMQNVNRNFFSDIRRYHPSIARVLDNNRNQRAGYMASLMEQGKREGLIRENLKSQIASFLLIAQVDFLFNSDEIFVSHYSLTEIYETIFMNFIRGIATSQGIMFIDEFMSKTESLQKSNNLKYE